MNIPTIEQFKEIANTAEGDFSYHGEYRGRFFYEGIGLVADSTAEAANFVIAMREAGYAFPAWDHQDQLGLGVIVAWEHENFMSEAAA